MSSSGWRAAIKITRDHLDSYLILTRQAGAWRRATGAFIAAAGIACRRITAGLVDLLESDVWNPGAPVGWLGSVTRSGRRRRSACFTIPSISATTFAIIAMIAGAGLWIAGQGPPTILALWRSLFKATESLASPISWSLSLHWIVLLIVWLALAADGRAHGNGGLPSWQSFSGPPPSGGYLTAPTKVRRPRVVHPSIRLLLSGDGCHRAGHVTASRSSSIAWY